MTDYTEQGAIPVEDAAIDDPPTEAEVREAQLEQHPEQARTATGRPGPLPDESDPPPLRVLALNCTLKASPAKSSSDRMIELLTASFAELGATCIAKRVVDHDVRFGVSTDEGNGDEWPLLRAEILDADIVLVATPIWLGHPSSVCQMMMERLDAELSETDDHGRLSMVGKVAAVAVVGNEDGAHHVVAQVLQGLNDVGFAIAAQAGTYWVGEAMQRVDFLDLDNVPEAITNSVQTVARHAVHLAQLLRVAPFPPPE